MGQSGRPNPRVFATVFGVLPCLLGVGLGQYLRWNGTVWLTDAGGFWPIFCCVASVLALTYLALTTVYDKTVRAAAWLMLAWTWLYVPFWLTAVALPKFSAVVGSDGRVYIVSDWMRPDSSRVWLFAGRGSNKVVRNVEGSATINAVDVSYKFANAYIASCGNDEDIARPLVDSLTAALTTEIGKSRSLRLPLFESKIAQSQFLTGVCHDTWGSKSPCPVKLTIAPNSAATLPGGLWSKHFTEQEAIDERYLPALLNLLTQDNSRLVRKNEVYGLFMELAESATDLAKLAGKPQQLDDAQLDAVIKRILLSPQAGNEALSLYKSVSRLTQEQREALRAKALNEADIASIIKQYGAGRITDSELAQLARRMRPEFGKNPDLAIQTLEAFGERLPQDLRTSAVEGVVGAGASHALSALRHLDFSSPLRSVLLRKIIAEASLKDLDGISSRGKFEELLTPAEARSLIASIIAKAHASKDWLDFAVRVLPARAMTADERKAIIDELMFVSNKSALEFVSENRQYLDASEVSSVTRDYARTVVPDFCLHLTHRNLNRQIDYFSDAQIEIFRKCAQKK